MSQSYLLPCSCGQHVRVASAQAGGQVTCACGQHLSVPTLRGLRQLALAPPEIQGPAAGSWGKAHGVLFASGLLIAGVGVFLISTYLFRYAQIRYAQVGGKGLTVDRSAEVTTAMAGEIDKLTPVQALDLWKTEVLTEGLGQAQKPLWIAAKERLAEYARWMKIGGIVLAAGVLLSVVTLFVGRRA
jgi:hypothetical protein